MNRLAWALVFGFLGLQAALAWASWARARQESLTYVFTPLLDVAPAGEPLTVEEARALHQSLGAIDRARMSETLGRLGSTLSLDDLLRSLEVLQSSAAPLDAGQREAISAILTRARADYQDMRRVQGDILDTERTLDDQVRDLLGALPPEVAQSVRASKGARP